MPLIFVTYSSIGDSTAQLQHTTPEVTSPACTFLMKKKWDGSVQLGQRAADIQKLATRARSSSVMLVQYSYDGGLVEYWPLVHQVCGTRGYPRPQGLGCATKCNSSNAHP